MLFPPAYRGARGGSVGNFGVRKRNDTKHFVRMRGLPFEATNDDISKFFHPLCITNLKLKQDKLGRATGTAEVEFSCHNDAVDAMKRDREKIGHRYIELFLESIASEKLNLVGGNHSR